MVDLGTYEFKDFESVHITPQELFMNTYAEEVYESGQILTYDECLSVILDATY